MGGYCSWGFIWLRTTNIVYRTEMRLAMKVPFLVRWSKYFCQGAALVVGESKRG